MTAFSASPRLGLSGGLLILVLSSAALAQPVELRRPTPELVAETPDDGATPPEQTQPDPDTPLRAQQPLVRDGIVIDVLESFNPDGFGPLDEKQGGLPTDLWRNVGWSVIRSLLPRVPGHTKSRAMRTLASRLLQSRAILPADKPKDESYLGLRADRLLAMADVAGALSLMQAVPAQDRDEAFSMTEIEALFFDNRNGEACARAAALDGRYRGTYWKQLEAFCLALGGNHVRAGLISDLLREREQQIELAFFAAIDVLAGRGSSEVNTVGAPSGLVLAMMRAASIGLPPTIAETDSPIVLRWIARSPNADLDTRLAAAEKALALGAMTSEEMVGIYGSLPFLDQELKAPVAYAQANWGPRGRALLVSAAIAQETPAAKAETLRQGWDIAREKGGYDELSRASAAVVATIEATPELIWFARNAARVLLAAGRVDAAMAWYSTAVGARGDSEEAEAVAADLWPLATLVRAANGEAPEPDQLDSWSEDIRRADGEEALAKTAALLALLGALGNELPPEAWQALLTGPLVDSAPALNAVWHNRLATAAAEKQVGETALLVTAAATAAGGGAYESSANAAAAVAALHRAGLRDDAMRLALEGAMTAGL